MKPNCYKCKHRRDIPGDCHSQCVHPDIGIEGSSLEALVELLMNPGKLTQAVDKLGIKGSPWGIKNGWFHWPANFDPAWLGNCNGFEEKEK